MVAKIPSTSSTPLTPITPKERAVLEFIKTHLNEHGYAPTFAEIRDALGYKATSSVQQFIEQLTQKGHLDFPLGENRKRALVLTATELPIPIHSSLISIPLEGSVAAGVLKQSYQNREMIEVPRYLLKSSQDYFALKVKGDSMIEDCILDGDLVIIKRQHHAANGQTVVALVGDEATIKRYYRKKNSIELHPANPRYDIIQVKPTAEFKILGILSSVIRSME